MSYSSSVAVGDPGLSPFEATLVLGGLLLVAGGVTYLMLRPASTPVASNVQPVPVPNVQPITTPGSPGY